MRKSCYFSYGQQIPEDIETVQAMQFVRRACAQNIEFEGENWHELTRALQGKAEAIYAE